MRSMKRLKRMILTAKGQIPIPARIPSCCLSRLNSSPNSRLETANEGKACRNQRDETAPEESHRWFIITHKSVLFNDLQPTSTDNTGSEAVNKPCDKTRKNMAADTLILECTARIRFVIFRLFCKNHKYLLLLTKKLSNLKA